MVTSLFISYMLITCRNIYIMLNHRIMTFKCTFIDKYEPNLQVITFFDAERGNVIATARSICLQMFSTTDDINAKIEKL